MSRRYLQYQSRAETYPAITRDSEVSAWQQKPQVPHAVPYVTALLVSSTAFVSVVEASTPTPVESVGPTRIEGPRVDPLFVAASTLVQVVEETPSPVPGAEIPRTETPDVTALSLSGGTFVDFSVPPVEVFVPIPATPAQRPPGRFMLATGGPSLEVILSIPPVLSQPDIPTFPADRTYLLSGTVWIDPTARTGDNVFLPIQPIDIPQRIPDTRHLNGVSVWPTFSQAATVIPPIQQADIPTFQPDRTSLQTAAIWVDATPTPPPTFRQTSLPAFGVDLTYLEGRTIWIDPTPRTGDDVVLPIQPIDIPTLLPHTSYLKIGGVVPLSVAVFVEGVSDEWVIDGGQEWEVEGEQSW